MSDESSQALPRRPGATAVAQNVDELAPALTAQIATSFIASQRSVGVIGLFLPVSLLVWSLIYGDGVRGSLSEYYYTPVRDLFVGTLTALSFFLFSYRGYSPNIRELTADRIASKIAGVAALTMALSPVKPRQDDRCTLVQCVIGPRWADLLHAGGAVVFFSTLTIFCLVLFPRSQVPDAASDRRRVLYLASGWTIVVTLLLIVGWKFLPPEVLFAFGRYKPIFWLEALAVAAFAVAWLARGNAIESQTVKAMHEQKRS